VAPPPDPAGERTVLPSRLAGFKGHTSKGRKGRKDERVGQGKRKKRGQGPTSKVREKGRREESGGKV